MKSNQHGRRRLGSTVVGCGLAALFVALLPPFTAWAEADNSPPTDWIVATAAEAKSLERGDDSVMDKYYDEESGELLPRMAPAGSVQPNPHICSLKVADVHWRESSGYTKIGFKPTTKCETKPVGISYTNELEKHMVLGVWKSEWSGLYILKAKDLTATTTKNGFIYKDISKKCDNTLSTDWRGKTSSTLKASNGVTYYARQYSPHVFTAACGT
ncbi:MAG: hypothetical protein QM628_16445 [Propionicimonas sp.]